MTRGTGRGGSPGAPRSVDVARLAGVSQKTVSRVFNDEPYVSADVRRRVLEAAEELGYRRNNAARALASGRTRSIGVVTLGTALYGPASLLMGVERAVRDTGYALRVVNTMEGDPAGVAGAVDSLLDQGVDGIVISEPIDEEARRGPVRPRRRAGPGPRRAAALRRARTVLTAGGGADLLARAATEHLLELGHATVHHLAGPQRWYAARDRLEGWRAALRRTRRGRAAGRRGRLVGRVRLRGGPGTGRRPDGDRGVRRQRRHGHRSDPRADARPAGGCRRTSASSASTTSRSPPTSLPR